MKAHVKINISIQFEDETSAAVDPRTAETLKYPLTVQHAGTVSVADRSEGDRVIEMLNNHIRTTFAQMSIVKAEGAHVPDLAAAFGGEVPPTILEPGESMKTPGGYAIENGTTRSLTVKVK